MVLSTPRLGSFLPELLSGILDDAAVPPCRPVEPGNVIRVEGHHDNGLALLMQDLPQSHALHAGR